LNFVLQLLAWIKERNFIVFTVPQKNSKVKDALEVASSLDRLEPFYHISIAPRRKPSALHTVAKEFNITEFFDATGQFYEANFFAQLKPILQEFVNNNKSTN
jgi:hypothetical protein